MSINLDYYKVFYYVAKFESVTLAANELFISQPAVSQVIKNLQKSLSCTLFKRSPKGVKLTLEGEILYKYVSDGFEKILIGEKKLKEFLNLESGQINIGASDMTLKFYLLPIITKFHKLYPKIKMKVTNASTPQTMEHLKQGIIDFGVVSGNLKKESWFQGKNLKEIDDILIANINENSLKNREIKLKELETIPMITLENNSSTRKYLDKFLNENGVLINPEFELATSELIVEFVLRNLGVGAVMSEFAKEHIKNGEVFKLKLEKELPVRNFFLVTNNKLPISPAAKKLIELVEKENN